MKSDPIPCDNNQKVNTRIIPHRETIVNILNRAAEDQKFLARLAEKPYSVLLEYELTQEERLALAKGDVTKLESWVGILDKRMKTWVNVRKNRDKW